MDTAGYSEREGWDEWKRVGLTCVPFHHKLDSWREAAAYLAGSSAWCSPEGWDGWAWGRRAASEGGMCMHVADSLPCTAETNTAS